MSEYIEFKTLLRRGLKGKTDVVVVLAKKHQGMLLGHIKWYGAWRQYTFWPEANTILNHGCMYTIADECKRMTRQHRAERMTRHESRS